MAVDAYVSNDERLNDGLTQSAQLTSTALEGVRHRMLYDSVIREAQRRIELVDAEMRVTAKEVAALRALVAQAVDRRDGSREDRDKLIDSQPAIHADIAATRAVISEAEVTIAELEEEILAFERMAVTRRWTGVQGTDAARPALAVKIDNVTRAHPQAGLNQADVVYEELVEGGVTRLVAVFQSTSVDVVGPVRQRLVTQTVAESTNPGRALMTVGVLSFLIGRLALLTALTMKTFEELDYAQTALGELILRRRRTTRGEEVFEVKLDGLTSGTYTAGQAVAQTSSGATGKVKTTVKCKRGDLKGTHHRGGLLGQASVLTAPANGVDTSPVVRGIWILENLFGTPPSHPPREARAAVERPPAMARRIASVG